MCALEDGFIVADDFLDLGGAFYNMNFETKCKATEQLWAERGVLTWIHTILGRRQIIMGCRLRMCAIRGRLKSRVLSPLLWSMVEYGLHAQLSRQGVSIPARLC